MIFVILIFYVLPVLLLTDLLITAYKLAKGEGDEVLLIHAIIGVLATLIPLINLKVLLGLALGIVLMVGCSGTPTANGSYNGIVINRIGTFSSSVRNDGTIHTFTYKGNEYIVASNGYKGGISLIQINK